MAGVDSLPYAFARAGGIVLAGVEEDGRARLWASPGASLEAIGEARRALRRPILVERVDQPAFDRRLSELYGAGDTTAADVAADVAESLESQEDLAQLVESLPPIEDLLDAAHDVPVIRMINALLTQAVREDASDVHIEPFERHSSVRLRKDGDLREVLAPHRGLHAALVSRIKVMAGLDIAERRLPQDGRMTIRLAGKPIDVRVSTVPVHHGERVVMRLLDKNPERLRLESLGMSADMLKTFDGCVTQPHGIILVTGPTGSGKTTTLYSVLRRLDARKLNIMTVEDPVEYDLPDIGQIAVNPRIDLDFAKALRAILRQDPDVVMIGEIRDLETARIAVQASLTGHLVLATLHTNDAPAAINRLVDMGIEPFLLASSLTAVLAQRLVRQLCPDCAEKRPATAAECDLLPGLKPGEMLAHPVGCRNCGHTGYSGRTGIFELLVLDDALRARIHARASEAQLRTDAIQSGRMVAMRADGLRWLRAGATAPEELLTTVRD